MVRLYLENGAHELRLPSSSIFNLHSVVPARTDRHDDDVSFAGPMEGTKPVISKPKLILDLTLISLLNIQLLVTNLFKKELGLTHVISLAFPVLVEVFADEQSSDGLLLTQIALVCSLAFISHKTENFYGSLAAACKFVDEIIVQLFIFNDDEPPSTASHIFSTICRSLFCVLSALSVATPSA